MAKIIEQQTDGSVIVSEVVAPGKVRSWSYRSLAELKKQQGELTAAELNAVPAIKAALDALK